jgi:hypothetical protein
LIKPIVEIRMSDDQPYEVPDAANMHPLDMQHIQLTYITHFYLDQKSPDSLLQLLQQYQAYAPEVLDQLHFVVVDDGSPLTFELPELNLNLTWLRITDNIPWNQGGARNLGVVYAKSDKILLADLDLEFPEHTLAWLIRARNPGKSFYKIYRRDPHSGELHKGHSNTFFMSRARLLRLYSYDEEYSGGYGAEDYRLVKYLKYHGTWQRYLPKKFYCRNRAAIDREQAYHSLQRDFSRNTPIDRRKRSELLTWGAETGHSRIFLNFNWQVVRQYRRPRVLYFRPRRWWKHGWILRTLMRSYD